MANDFTIANFIAKLIIMISFIKLVNEALFSLFDCWNCTFILHITKFVTGTATSLNFAMHRKHAQNGSPLMVDHFLPYKF